MSILTDELRDLPSDLAAEWNLLSPDMRATIRYLARPCSTNHEGVSLQTMLRQWQWQVPEGGRAALCAATGTLFRPRGIAAPRIHRLDPTEGLVRENMILVCAAYARLRKDHRVWGEQGHHDVMSWMRACIEWMDGDERDSLTERIEQQEVER